MGNGFVDHLANMANSYEYLLPRDKIGGSKGVIL